MENNNHKTALTLAIVALATCELVLTSNSILSLFSIYSSFGNSLMALLLAGGPITMGIIALNLIKTAQNPKRVFVILVRAFSIIAISLAGFFLFIELIVYGSLSSLINFAV
jgi:hypothetical protein